MKFNKKLIIPVACVLAITIAGLIIIKVKTFPDSKTESNLVLRKVDVVHPISVVHQNNMTFPGRVQPNEEAILFFRVSGPLVKVHAKPGDTVKKGDLLMKIDSRDYERRIASIKSQIKASEAEFEFTEKEYERNSNLLKENAASKHLYDQSYCSHLRAEAMLDNLKTQLQIAKDQLEDTILVAPFDATITGQFLENYEMVRMGEPVLTMHNISVVEIAADVPENHVADFIQTTADKEYQVNFFTLGNRSFSAQLHEWSQKSDPQTGTYRFVFRISQPDQTILLPGMTAELVVNSNSRIPNSAYLVPIESLTKISRGKGVLWVYNPDDKTLAMRGFVLSDNYNEQGVIVENNLRSDELVVAKGAHLCRQGERVDAQVTEFMPMEKIASVVEAK